MATSRLNTKRSFTGHHVLLPASQPGLEPVRHVPTYTLLTWTFGRGSVIWRIWPACVLHTVFAAVVVTVSLKTEYKLDIPSVMLTVLGVVIGFVISYRASSGYDRYWMGRTCWSDIIRNSRSLGRLIWFHVPPRLSPKTQEEIDSGNLNRTTKELNQVMAEKRMALDLVEGFAVALKHHLRGESGVYYDDLYHLVRPLHDHDHPANANSAHTSAVAISRRPQRITAQPPLPQPRPSSGPVDSEFPDPVIPPINAYGTFDAKSRLSPRHRRRSHSVSSTSSQSSHHHPLLPSTLPTADTVMSKVSGDLIPFASFYGAIKSYFASDQRPLEVLPPNITEVQEAGREGEGGVQRMWGGPVFSDRPVHGYLRTRRRPRVAGGGENLPLEILRCLSEWFSVLEDRGTVPGTSLGSMVGDISNFEDSLSALERILTTPLPFVYSVHISTVWLYLFFLPFQLISQFGWYTIPGVAIASFIYLGFLAAGEEIEQPFGYDENDLDLDLFCQYIIHADIVHLKQSPCLNAYLGHQKHYPVHRMSLTLVEATERAREEEHIDVAS